MGLEPCFSTPLFFLVGQADHLLFQLAQRFFPVCEILRSCLELRLLLFLSFSKRREFGLHRKNTVSQFSFLSFQTQQSQFFWSAQCWLTVIRGA